MKSKLISVCPAALNGLALHSPMPREMNIYQRCQMPLVVDENFTMVMQMPDTDSLLCDHSEEPFYQNINHQKVDSFVERAEALCRDELAAALLVPRSEVFSSSLHDCVPCVGCRRSMEELFNRLKVQQLSRAIEPLMITPRAELSVTHDVLYDSRQLYSILTTQGEKLNNVVDAIHKNRRNKRCQLHSLDSHKVRLLSNWVDIWEAMEMPCREEVLTISSCALKSTTDSYLSKHRFCSECKSKVMTAFHILVQDQNPPADFCPELYQGLRFCPRERHLHVLCETEFIESLVTRAEPDLSGVRRERHAKTLESAQEEILTCLGLHIYDRLHRIRQKALAEEQTWSLLVHVGMFKLQKAFEVALDAKQGMNRIDLICQEINREDEEKQLKREQKKQRKKAKKKSKMVAKRQDSSEEAASAKRKPHRCCEAEKENEPNCECLSSQVQETKKPSSPVPAHLQLLTSVEHSHDVPDHVTDNKGEGKPSGGNNNNGPPGLGEICADCKGEKSTSSSKPNSIQGSSEYENDVVAKICRCSNERQLRHAVGWTQTLQDMLEETHLFHEEDCKLKPEEIDEFHASHKCLERQRAQLRRNIHQRFWQKVGSNTATAVDVSACNHRNIVKA